MLKPDRLLARDTEWTTLVDFATHPAATLRLGVVSGRRRVGKSYLLRALVAAAGGLYVTAVAEEDALGARRRFATDIARYAGVGAALVGTDADWETLLTTAIDLVVRRHGPTGLVVIDELPYWLAHSPQITGLVQLLYDRSQSVDGSRGGRLIVCGSAISVMNTLLSGTKALRGRAAVDLRLAPFDLPTTARHWSINDPTTALYLHAAIGGSPGYRDLAPASAPDSIADFDGWVTTTLLNPGQALFSRSETEYLLREDPAFTGSSLHYAILGAVAAGASSPAKIGGLIGRDRTTLSRPIDALVSAGYLRYESDLLWERRPVITIADPIVRFHNLITVTQNDLIETGRATDAWRAAQHTFASRILGQHFEECARDWLRRNGDTTMRGGAGVITATVVNDKSGRIKHEIDVLALDRRGSSPTVTLIGEAKATLARRGPADLDRLDTLAGLLDGQGVDTAGARRAIFSLHGFHTDLVKIARDRGDVLLIDLPAMLDRQAPPVLPLPT